MDKKYRLIFNGRVKEGHHPSIVKKKLAVLLRKDEEIIARLFSGSPKVIKKNVDWTTCQKIQNTFLSIGALTIIEEMKEAPEDVNESSPPLPATTPYQEIASTNNQADPDHEQSGGHSFSLRSIFHRFKNITFSLDSAKSAFSQLKSIDVQKMRDAKSSIQYDYNTGGIGQMIKNRFLHSIIGVFLLLTIILFAVLNYENNPMPPTRDNLSQLADHIEFIEKSFTVEGLAKRSKSKREYLDYLLIEPITKAGYDFADTLEDLVEDFLDDELEGVEKAFATTYLRIAIDEKNNLLQQKLISTGLAKKLGKASKKINNKLKQNPASSP